MTRSKAVITRALGNAYSTVSAGHSRGHASTTVSTRIARPVASRSWTKSIAQHSFGVAGAGRATRGPTGRRLRRRRWTPSPSAR
jgi:hypothetical protein